MYRLRISFSVIGIILFLGSCSFIDLRPIEISISPENSGAVLPGEYSPLSIRFSTAMEKNVAEKAVSVSSDMGLVYGDRIWNGNTLQFVPVAGWTAGTRYTLNLSGTVRSEDGREIRLDRTLFFYAFNCLPPPAVIGYSPTDGESVSTENTNLQIQFSQAMDKSSVELALSVDSMGDKKIEWPNDSTLKIIPGKKLSAWTVYRWQIAVSAKSINGVPLAKAVSAIFVTDIDTVVPEVYGVYPAIQSDRNWFPTGGSMERDFGPGLGILIEFTKPMSDTVTRSLRFEPQLAGAAEMLNEKSMIFIPVRDPEPEITYTLIIPADTADSGGLKMGSDYRLPFKANIGYLQILSINDLNGCSLDLHELPEIETPVLPVTLSDGDGDLGRFIIYFSRLFNNEDKQKTALAVSLVPFFPINLDPIALRYVLWLSDDRLYMEWERLKPGAGNEYHFYKLLIPGGKAGINSGGEYLKRDIVVYLEAVK